MIFPVKPSLTSRGKRPIAKDFLAVMIINSCKSEFDDNEDDEKFYEDVENNISDYALFFAKVRKGEVWDMDKSKYYELDIERPTGVIPERWRNKPLTVYYCPLCGRKL